MPRRFESVRNETIVSEMVNHWTRDVIVFLAGCIFIVSLLISFPLLPSPPHSATS